MSDDTAFEHPDYKQNRVVMKYEVPGTGNVLPELPFVMGVIGDFSGDIDPERPLEPLKKRDFVEIDKENFSEVMADIKPRLQYSVQNPLAEDELIPVELTFESMDDFSPDKLVNRIPALKAMQDVRDRLVALAGRAESNDKLAELLERVVQQDMSIEDMLKQLEG